MIKTALIVILAILLIISLSALLLYRRQVRELSRQLKDLEPGSNQRLTCSVRDRNFLSLCRMVNTYIDSQQKLVLQAKEAEGSGTAFGSAFPLHQADQRRSRASYGTGPGFSSAL